MINPPFGYGGSLLDKASFGGVRNAREVGALVEANAARWPATYNFDWESDYVETVSDEVRRALLFDCQLSRKLFCSAAFGFSASR